MQPEHAQYITSSTSRKKSVILPVREYQRLLEDPHGLSVVAERREKYPVSLNDIKKLPANP